VLIALDRMERSGPDGQLSPSSAVQEVSKQYGIPVISIGNLDDLFGYLNGAGADPELLQHKEAVSAYRARYGIKVQRLKSCVAPLAQPLRRLRRHPPCVRSGGLERAPFNANDLVQSLSRLRARRGLLSRRPMALADGQQQPRGLAARAAAHAAPPEMAVSRTACSPSLHLRVD
jgi:hypothetical protein